MLLPLLLLCLWLRLPLLLLVLVLVLLMLLSPALLPLSCINYLPFCCCWARVFFHSPPDQQKGHVRGRAVPM